MKISRNEILRIKVGHYFERCDAFTERLPAILVVVKDAPDLLENWEAMREGAIVSGDWEAYERAEKKRRAVQARAMGSLWALYAAGKAYGVDVPVKPWEIYGKREFRRLVPCCNELVEKWATDWDEEGEDEREVLNTFRGVYEYELARLQYEQEQIALFVGDAVEMRLQELESLDFAVLEYITRGEIYNGIYRDSNWRDIARELAALSYYQKLARKLPQRKIAADGYRVGETARETPKKAGADTDCGKSTNNDAGISVRSAIKKMAGFGYFDARKDMPATYIARELAEILGGTENYARKVYREAMGLDKGGREK